MYLLYKYIFSIYINVFYIYISKYILDDDKINIVNLWTYKFAIIVQLKKK